MAWAQRQSESAARVKALSAEIDAQTGALTENGAAMVADTPALGAEEGTVLDLGAKVLRSPALRLDFSGYRIANDIHTANGMTGWAMSSGKTLDFWDAALYR